MISTRPVTLLKAENDVDGLETGVVTIQEGRIFYVTLIFHPGMVRGAFQGTITVHTDHPKLLKLEVPVQGLVP